MVQISPIRDQKLVPVGFYGDFISCPRYSQIVAGLGRFCVIHVMNVSLRSVLIFNTRAYVEAITASQSGCILR